MSQKKKKKKTPQIYKFLKLPSQGFHILKSLYDMIVYYKCYQIHFFQYIQLNDH